MIRRFLSGLLWGTAASVAGLSLISQVAIPPNRAFIAAKDVNAPENSVVAKVEAPNPTDAAPDPLAPAKGATNGTETSNAQVKGDAPDEAATKAESGTSVALPEISTTPEPDSVATQVVPQTAPIVIANGASESDVVADASDATPVAPPSVAPPSVSEPSVSEPSVAQPSVNSTLPEIQKTLPSTMAKPVVSAVEAAPQATETKEISSTETAESAPKVEDAPAMIEAAVPEIEPATPVPAEPAPTEAAPETSGPVSPGAAPDAKQANSVPAESPAKLPVQEPVTPEPVAPDVAAVKPEAEPSLLKPNSDVTLSPDTGLRDQVEGVVTGRLAVIEPKAVEPSDANSAEADPNLITLPLAPGDEASPLVQFAQEFDNATGKPLFAILLVDDGSADLDRSALAKIPLPVSFVIDPLAPNAKEAAAIYRAAGHEILMMASGIPQGATAGDVEQTFQAHAGVLPESVAVLDLSQDGFQDNRPLATMVVPVLGAQGRGLVTFDRGLNAADQVARRESVPAATIFRVLDAEGENPALMRRYLDRAAFKAAQEGQVIVLGSAKPETVSVILEWAVEGRSTTVTLAPATAVLQAN